jgi:hypothetical protein
LSPCGRRKVPDTSPPASAGQRLTGDQGDRRHHDSPQPDYRTDRRLSPSSGCAQWLEHQLQRGGYTRVVLTGLLTSLPALSGGRVILGTGAGAIWDMIVKLGIPGSTTSSVPAAAHIHAPIFRHDQD